MEKYTFILLNKDNLKVLVKSNGDSTLAYHKMVNILGKGIDPMLIKVNDTELKGFAGIEPRASDKYLGEPDIIIN